MDTFHNLARQRRSCRRFTSDPISKEKLNMLLDTVLMSPASKHSNPWHFVVVDQKVLLEKLSLCKPHGAKMLNQAATAIIVLADPEKSDVWIEDASIASIYLQLCAEDIGLGSCWVQVRERSNNDNKSAEDYIKDLLGIPSTMRIESIIALGYKAEAKAPFAPANKLLNRVHYNAFNNKTE